MANDCGDIACGDITTRANVQLRGMTLETSDKIFAVRSLAPRLACSDCLHSASPMAFRDAMCVTMETATQFSQAV